MGGFGIAPILNSRFAHPKCFNKKGIVTPSTEQIALKTDNRVIGLAVISLIVSGLIVFSFAREVVDQPVEIIKNEIPSIGETIFTFALVAREDIENLELRFLFLIPDHRVRAEELVVPDAFGKVNDMIGGYHIEPGNGPEDVLANIRRLGWFEERMANQNIVPEEDSTKIEFAGAEYDLLYVDYSQIMDYVIGANETANLPLVYAALTNSTGHSLYMEGSSAFYSWLGTKHIAISHNEKKTTYVLEHQLTGAPDEFPLSAAPRGTPIFESVKRDDTISVVINIDPLAEGVYNTLFYLQIIKVYADGELFGKPIVNVLE
jgi:hypothetical protein